MTPLAALAAPSSPNPNPYHNHNLGWASSWTSPLSPRPPGGIPASEATQGEYNSTLKP